MVTLNLPKVTTQVVLAGLFGALSACSTGAGTVGAGSPGSPGAPGVPSPGAPGTAAGDPSHPIPVAATRYAGKGFVVHEWGTNTIVVGSDGSMQRGLHHEEEDLPAFVYDRLKAGALGTSVDVKMETPITYFYSDKPLQAQVKDVAVILLAGGTGSRMKADRPKQFLELQGKSVLQRSLDLFAGLQGVSR